MTIIEAIATIVPSLGAIVGSIFAFRKQLIAIKVDMELIKGNIDLEVENNKAIQELYQIRDHYVKRFKYDNWKNAITELSDKLIQVAENLIENYEIKLSNYDSIKNSFCTARAYNENRLIEYLGPDETKRIYNKLTKNFNAFLVQIEDILTSCENHRKQKFKKLVSEFLREYLKQMLKEEK